MTMTASLELGGWGGVGEWGLALSFPLGGPCPGNWPLSPHMVHRQRLCRGEGSGSQPTHLTPQPLPSRQLSTGRAASPGQAPG